MARKLTKIFMGSIRWFKYTNISAQTDSNTVNTQPSSLIYRVIEKDGRDLKPL